MVLQKFVLNRRAENPDYDGLADLFIHIHAPFKPDSPLRWGVRSFISFLLAFFGGSVGPEGAAVEFMQAAKMKIRARSSRWFEQKRRTDAATSLAAGISAAFGAPFAGFLLPIELGVGGRNTSTITSALAAFLTIRYLNYRFSAELLDINGVLSGFHFSVWREWVGIVVVGIVAGIVGTVTIRFIRYTQEGLLSLFQTQAWMRVLAGAVVLALIFFIYRPFHQPSWVLLEQVLWNKLPPSEVTLLLFTQVLSLSVVLSGFGTMGLFWPLFAMGGFLGYCVNYWVLNGMVDFSAAASLVGGAALWSAVLGTPIVGAVLAFEFTQNLSILLPCLIAAFIAREIRQLLRTKTLVDKDLEARGLFMSEGRSTNVLSAITVRDAMITDHEVVHEQEPISELQERILKARYPFLPVVNTQGIFSGLLTIDMVQDSSHFPVAKVLEAKDLLYRSGFKSPTVKAGDRLSAVVGFFDEAPCIPVLADDGRVQGLLFVYSVRLAYDREVTKRSFSIERIVE